MDDKNMEQRPTLICLVGLPACGKSTWRAAFMAHNDFKGVVASTDDIIDEYANQNNLTYDDVFAGYIDEANTIYDKMLHFAFQKRADIIIDRTNMNVKSRSKFMRRAKNLNYDCIAVVFEPPVKPEEHQEHQRRLANRPGKTIPQKVLYDMAAKYQTPTAEEGFSLIEYVDSFNTPVNEQKVTYEL
jgi:predicted kinase